MEHRTVSLASSLSLSLSLSQCIVCVTRSPLDPRALSSAPAVTGLHTLDAHLQAQLLLAAISITLHLLSPGGTFIAKIFRTHQDPRAEFLVSQMRTFFPESASPSSDSGVWIRKPRSSREGSGEAFIVCKGFTPPASLEKYLSHLPVEGEEANASLMQAFVDPSLLSAASGAGEGGVGTQEGEAEGELDKERKQILGWVGGGDLRYVLGLLDLLCLLRTPHTRGMLEADGCALLFRLGCDSAWD